MAEKDGTAWGLTHTYFANIGGFILDFSDVLHQQSSGLSPDNTSALDRLADEAELDDSPAYYEHINLLRMRHKERALNADQILIARDQGLIKIFHTKPGNNARS